jgi:cytochrome c oxidase subunit 2
MNTLGGLNLGLPAQAAAEAVPIDFGIRLIHVAMLAMFLLWGGFMAWCLIRFRARPGHAAVPLRDEGLLIAMIPDALVVIFEVALILSYGIPYWSRLKMHPPAEADSTVIRVVAEQFAWNYHYPGADGVFGRTSADLVSMSNPVGLDRNDPAAADDIVSVNDAAVPLGRPVLLQISSKDVVHDWFVPEFRVKTDAVPGLRVPLWFHPNRIGTFEVVCAQLCGIAHYAMHGKFHVMEPDAYAAWLTSRPR